MKICPKCQAKNADRAATCFKCGASLTERELEMQREQHRQQLRAQQEEEERRREEVKREMEMQREQHRQQLRAQQEEEERRREEVRRISEEARSADIREKAKINDIYEYDVVTIRDNAAGGTNINELKYVLQSHGREG